MSYKLTYFNIPGRGEPARLIFAAAGVKFVDNQVSFADWPAVKESLGVQFLPLLEVGDKRLTQSNTIFRYLGSTFKLAGADEWEAAKCNELVDTLGDLVEVYIQFNFKEQDPVKKDEKKKAFEAQALPGFLGKIDKILKDNGGSWLVGKSITWADIVVVEYLRQMLEVCEDPSLVDGFPHVKQLQDAVNSNPNIKAYRNGKK